MKLQAISTGLLVSLLFAVGPTTVAQDMALAGLMHPNVYESADILPEAIRNIAKAAKPGIVLKKARLSWRNDEGTYIILGDYYSQKWRVRVTASGRVLSVTRDA